MQTSSKDHGWLLLSRDESLERLRFDGESPPWLSLREEPLAVGVYAWNYGMALLLALPAILLFVTGVSALRPLAALLLLPGAILLAWLTLSLAATLVFLPLGLVFGRLRGRPRLLDTAAP